MSFEDAGDMAAAGVGLGIMTMGALVPLVIMKKVLDQKGSFKLNQNSGFSVNIPKININTNALVCKKRK